MSTVWPYLAAIIPTILVAILFYFLIKGMLEGDRRERLAQKQFEAEQDRRAAAGARASGVAAPADAPTDVASPAPSPGNAGEVTDDPSDNPGNTSPQS